MAGQWEFAAAAHVLRAPVFADHNEPYLDDERRDVDWQPILEYPWSDGERILVDLALELWTGRQGNSGFGDLIRALDAENFERAIDALLIRRGLVRVMA